MEAMGEPAGVGDLWVVAAVPPPWPHPIRRSIAASARTLMLA